ncbi:phosphodiester glycosidase family protein [Altericista sp. CCNU0014]|uniref:phosphodiester glycosidase family protein n=1 Tax=Altericista sp. CCNU0014 TaxID=3082949 RepID=UPI00384DCCC2
MQKLWVLGLSIGGALLAGLLLNPHVRSRSGEKVAAVPALQYEVLKRSGSTVYTLAIPRDRRYAIRPFVAEGILTVGQVAERTGAIAAINAGFFDPVNQKTTSAIAIDGREVANPRDNERLVDNPKLSGYLSAILNRSEFRVYQCGTQVDYGIEFRSAAVPPGCQFRQAVGGGPQLLPNDTSQQEGFTAYDNGELIRDAIGSKQRNARTAIGLKPDGSVVWVMVAQTKARDSGMTLDELADFMKRLGVTSALNLDGGTSSSLYAQGKAAYGKRDETGQPIERAVKSVLLLMPMRTK